MLGKLASSEEYKPLRHTKAFLVQGRFGLFGLPKDAEAGIRQLPS